MKTGALSLTSMMFITCTFAVAVLRDDMCGP